MPVIEHQSTDPAKSITSVDVRATDTLTLLIKVPVTVTFYEDTIEPSVACPGLSPWSSCGQELFSHNYFYVGGCALPGPRLELNLEPAEHSASRSTAHGIRVV